MPVTLRKFMKLLNIQYYILPFLHKCTLLFYACSNISCTMRAVASSSCRPFGMYSYEISYNNRKQYNIVLFQYHPIDFIEPNAATEHAVYRVSHQGMSPVLANIFYKSDF